LSYDRGNIVKCPRCGRVLIAEEYPSDTCNPRFRGVKEIIIDWHYETKSDDGHNVVMAKGLDGVLYRLVECKHNPPHKTRSRPDESLQPSESDEDLTKPSFLAGIGGAA